MKQGLIIRIADCSKAASSTAGMYYTNMANGCFLLVNYTHILFYIIAMLGWLIANMLINCGIKCYLSIAP